MGQTYLGMSTPAAEQAAMTVDPLGMDTGSPFTVTSMLSEAGAACCCALVLVCRHLSEVLTQSASDLHARSDCAACVTRPSTMAALPCTIRRFSLFCRKPVLPRWTLWATLAPPWHVRACQLIRNILNATS